MVPPSYGGTDEPANASTEAPGDRCRARSRHNGGVPTTLEPTQVQEPDLDERVAPDHPWIVIVWNDPVNLMSYVTFVLQKLFGYSTEKATELMLDVHHKGKAVVANGSREQAEMHVFRLHEHGLWATMEKDGPDA
jgi:ATP-dependent Clp protease adaptor protein ClpS